MKLDRSWRGGRISRRKSRSFNPLAISGLTLWLDAKAQGTLFDSNVGGNVIADDGTVGRWEDRSGNGRHFTQATGANRPTWDVAGRVQFPFNATSSSVLLTSGQAVSNFVSTGDNCWIVVARYVGAPTAGTQLIGNPTSTGTFDLSVISGPAMRFVAWNGTSGQSIVSRSFAGDTTYVIMGRRAGTTLGISLNGGTESQVATAGALTQNVGNLGIPFPAAAASSELWLHEVLLFNLDPGLAIRNWAGASLAAKHGASWTPLSA